LLTDGVNLLISEAEHKTTDKSVDFLLDQLTEPSLKAAVYLVASESTSDSKPVTNWIGQAVQETAKISDNETKRTYFVAAIERGLKHQVFANDELAQKVIDHYSSVAIDDQHNGELLKVAGQMTEPANKLNALISATNNLKIQGVELGIIESTLVKVGTEQLIKDTISESFATKLQIIQQLETIHDPQIKVDIYLTASERTSDKELAGDLISRVIQHTTKVPKHQADTKLRNFSKAIKVGLKNRTFANDNLAYEVVDQYSAIVNDNLGNDDLVQVIDQMTKPANKLNTLINAINNLETQGIEPGGVKFTLIQTIIGSWTASDKIDSRATQKQIIQRLETINNSQTKIEIYLQVATKIDSNIRRPLITKSFEHIKMLAADNRNRVSLFETNVHLAAESNVFTSVPLAVDYIKTSQNIQPAKTGDLARKATRQLSVPHKQRPFLLQIIPYLNDKDALWAITTTRHLILKHSVSKAERSQQFRQLYKIAMPHPVLSQPQFCQEATLDLAKVGEFKLARQVMAKNKKVATNVAFETSTIAPGFAQDAFNLSIKEDRDSLLSVKQGKTVANIANEVAKYSPDLAEQTQRSLIEVAVNQAIEVDVAIAKKSFLKAAYQTSRPDTIHPGANFGSGNGNGSGSGGGSGGNSGNGGGREPYLGVKIVIDADFEEFFQIGEGKEIRFVNALAEMLRISPFDVFIADRQPGSVEYKIIFLDPALCAIVQKKFTFQEEDFSRLEEAIEEKIKNVEVFYPTQKDLEKLRYVRVTGQNTVHIDLTHRGGKMVDVKIKFSTDAQDKQIDVEFPFDEMELITVLKVLERQSVLAHPNSLIFQQDWRFYQVMLLHALGIFTTKKQTSPVSRLQLTKNLFADSIKLVKSPQKMSRYLVTFKRAWRSIPTVLLWKLGFKDGLIADDFATKIGDLIYDQGLGKNKGAFALLERSRAKAEDQNLGWEITVSDNETHLTRYPWELIALVLQWLDITIDNFTTNQTTRGLILAK
jgi:hypothetical protein